VIKEISPDEFNVLENVPTKRGARTLSIDAHTHNIYLPTAEFESDSKEGQRPQMKPGTFQVLVLAKKIM
jgi:hypothetical protein